MIKEKLEQKLDEEYEKRKNTVYVNGTGDYGKPFKEKIINHFDLDSRNSNIIMNLPFGTIMRIAEDLNIKM